MLSDFVTFTVALRADVGLEWIFAVFGILVLVKLFCNLLRKRGV